MSQSAFFPVKPSVCSYILIGNPEVWQMPGPQAVQNLQIPHPRDWQGGQMPRSSPGGELGAGGIDWCIKAGFH